jgi:hypothetical protein
MKTLAHCRKGLNQWLRQQVYIGDLRVIARVNRPNFRVPDSDISSPNFGRIQAAQSPRLIQLALKFLYRKRFLLGCRVGK